MCLYYVISILFDVVFMMTIVLASMNFQTSEGKFYEQQNHNGPGQAYEQQNDDLEYEGEIDGEGFMEPPRNERGANYTLDKEIFLCITWKHVEMDATMGTDQKGNTYWARMKEYFDAHNKSGYEQTDRSLCSRWGVISLECRKWSAMLANVDKITQVVQMIRIG
jgi:hypothetical protein